MWSKWVKYTQWQMYLFKSIIVIISVISLLIYWSSKYQNEEANLKNKLNKITARCGRLANSLLSLDQEISDL